MAAAIIGVISPSGNEIGPFLSVEQAGLTQLISNEKRTQIFRMVQHGRFICNRHGRACRRMACTNFAGQRLDAIGILSLRVDGLRDLVDLYFCFYFWACHLPSK